MAMMLLSVTAYCFAVCSGCDGAELDFSCLFQFLTLWLWLGPVLIWFLSKCSGLWRKSDQIFPARLIAGRRFSAPRRGISQIHHIFWHAVTD
jgi:hypothetical protein